MPNKILILENGTVFKGEGFGSGESKIAEVVFNTSMVGYQEIFSDPAYLDQFVVMTYPLIGNYGLTDEDFDSKGVFLAGFIVSEYNDLPSNFRTTMTLNESMCENNVVGISGVDTRKLTRIIRDEGTMKAMICDEGADIAECVKEIKAYKKEGNEVKRVSRNNVRHCPTRNPKYSVVVIDCGIRNVSLRKMNDCGINLAILPYNSTFEEVMNQKPDGVFIPNGPGDPSDVPETVELVKKLKGKLPVFAIGLGLQIVARAYGGKTLRMKKGHSGSNLPVKDVKTKEIEITSQHHLYTVDASSLKNSGLEVTKINVIDGDVEGVEDAKNGIFAVAYQPENCAEPGYNHAVYQKFLENIKKFAGGKSNAEKNRY